MQLIYPGLGGHSSVSMSMIEGDINKEFAHYLIGYGIENESYSLKNNIDNNGANFESVIKNLGLDIRSLIKVYKILKRINPDYIIMHSCSLIVIVWCYSLFNSKHFLSVEHQSNHVKSKKEWVYSFLILLMSPKVVYLSKSYKNEIKKKFKTFFNYNKCRVINNGINISKFKPRESKIKKGKTFIISMISRLNDLRDHKTLIDSFYEISMDLPSKLIIAGDGNTRQSLMLYVKQLKIESLVEFKGDIDENEIIKLIHSTDIYVHSSLAETLSTSLLQVMACKTPIIATNIPGINNLLENNKDALLFDPKNKKDLINKLKKLISDKDLAETISINSLAKINEHFSNVHMLKKYKFLLIN